MEAPALYDPRLIEAPEREKPKLLSIGGGLKFGTLHPLSMAFERSWDGKLYPTWTDCDDLVSLAARLGVPVRGDAVIWNDWIPAWVTDLAQKQPTGWRKTTQAAFERHFETIFARFDELDLKYKKRMMPWCGVVNEPFEPWGRGTGGRPGGRARGSRLSIADRTAFQDISTRPSNTPKSMGGRVIPRFS